MKPKYDFTIYTDGGSRGNPGEAAYGFVITDADNKILAEKGVCIGINTNNVAEYSGIMEALRWVEKNGQIKSPAIAVFMDSKLAIEQLSGRWKIKNENLRSLYYTIKTLERALNAEVTYSHVRREYNKEADRMVNLALDGLI